MAGNVNLPDPSARSVRLQGLTRWAPGLALLRNYRRVWLVPDLTAGMVWWVPSASPTRI